MSQTTPDRITVGLGEKLPGPVPYSSIDFQVSYATDLLAGETAVEAMARAKAFVMKQLEDAKGSRINSTRNAETGNGAAPAARSVSRFDPDNPEHQSLADQFFEKHRTPLRSRRYVAERILAGEPLDEIGALIDADQFNMKKTGGTRPQRSGFPPNVRKIDGSDSGWNGRFPRR